ncbi:alpha/beta hydrolase [Collinsella tanakaei]|uniref:alpha/beta hydrolase n=1 Tax=Collinsella tanakaei TaxID=626935 RepID=UPI001957757C|nr:hypothetical protein [Collinsella tanakaei]
MMRIETVSLPSSGYGSKPVTLTVYAQDNVAAHEGRRRPAVIVCPGGGYGFCSGCEAEPMALAFVARGLQAFVLDYTVLDEDETRPLLPYPQQDLARAVALVRENAEAWHVDADRIASWAARPAATCAQPIRGLHKMRPLPPSWALHRSRLR